MKKIPKLPWREETVKRFEASIKSARSNEPCWSEAVKTYKSDKSADKYMTNPLEFSSYAIPMKTEINYPQTSSAEGYLPQAETVYNKQPQKQLADTICNPQILSAESHPPEARTVYSTSHPRTLPAICKGCP